MADAKKTAAKAPAKAKAAEKVDPPADDKGTPSHEVVQENKVPADAPVEPKAVPTAVGTNVIHGNEYEVTADRGYRLKQ